MGRLFRKLGNTPSCRFCLNALVSTLFAMPSHSHSLCFLAHGFDFSMLSFVCFCFLDLTQLKACKWSFQFFQTFHLLSCPYSPPPPLQKVVCFSPGLGYFSLLPKTKKMVNGRTLYPTVLAFLPFALPPEGILPTVLCLSTLC